MCTLSIFSDEYKLIVTMNRDEQRSREEEGKLFFSDDTCFPLDKLSQGTWIGMNNNGLVFALLNRYQEPHYKNNMRSRGEIIPALLHSFTTQEAVQKLKEFTFEKFNPFDLVIISIEKLLQVTWNGQHLKIEDKDFQKPFFITSSSEKIEEVLEYRQDIFAEFTKNYSNNAEFILQKLHLQCAKDYENLSICMSREKTHTKSATQIIISSDAIEMFYWPKIQVSKAIELLRKTAIYKDFTFTKKNSQRFYS